MRTHARRITAIAVGCALLLPMLLLLVILGHLRGWGVDPQDPRAISSQLRPYDHVAKPEGDGPFPAVLLFHGCSGRGRDDVEWARAMREWGYVAIAVDSLAGRGLQGGSGGDLCVGRALMGRSRAGDVLVTLEDARSLPFVDPERIALAGWSHGGWTIMELLQMNPPELLPPSLASSSGLGLSGVRGAIFLYPYCGIANLGKSWRAEIASLFLLGDADRVISVEDCREVAHAHREMGHRVEERVYAGAAHAFDEQGEAGEHRPAYDPLAAADARLRVREFLAEIFR